MELCNLFTPFSGLSIENIIISIFFFSFFFFFSLFLEVVEVAVAAQ